MGAQGLLGGALTRLWPQALAWDRGELDITDFARVAQRLRAAAPAVIINCAAYNDVDGAEANFVAARLLNAGAVVNLAVVSRRLNSVLIHFSTNYVFDGQKGEYNESDLPSPISLYAESKAKGETAVLQSGCQYYLIRTALLFGRTSGSRGGKKPFVELMLDLSQKTDTIKAVADEVNSLTYAEDLAAAVKRLLAEHYAFGVYHLINSGSASWYEFAAEIFKLSGRTVKLTAVPGGEFPRPARRPKKSVLVNSKFPALRPWQAALREYLTQVQNAKIKM